MRSFLVTLGLASAGGLFAAMLGALALLASCAAPHPVYVRLPDPPPSANPDVANSFEACRAVCWERGRGYPVEVCETQDRKHCFCSPERL